MSRARTAQFARVLDSVMSETIAADATRAEVAAIVAWLRKHGMRQTADAIQRGDYKHD